MTQSLRGMRPCRLAALAVLLALGACQAPGGPTEDGLRGTVEPAPAADAAGQADAATGDSAAPPTIALRPAPPIDDDPDHFLGLDPEGLEDRLGPPDLLRRETPAEVWQYRSPLCVLDLFLYDKSDGKQVVYLEARDLEAAEMESRTCLRELLTARRDASAS